MSKVNPYNGRVQFMIVGRLVKEKGFDLLLDFFSVIDGSSLSGKVDFHIYGDGYYRQSISKLSKKYDYVHYYGFIPKEEIFKQWEKSHYTIMLSRFLETFGLTALDGLAVGTPIIGFKKGGLGQFIEDKYKIIEKDTQEDQIKSLEKRISKIVEKFDYETWNHESKSMKKLYKNYSWKIWYKNFSAFLPTKKKRIVIISDYSKDIGGIENRLLLVERKLTNEGYTVKFIGGVEKKVGNTAIFFNLFKTILNIPAGLRIKREVDNFEPDLIWWNSVHRTIGWYGLYLLRNYPKQQRIMYHDFGLFHPYPSLVYNEKQILEARKFSGFFREGLLGPIWKVPLLLFKWCSFLIIRKYLRIIISLHLVPSPFMLTSFITKKYIGKDASIDVLPHFVIGPGEK